MNDAAAARLPGVLLVGGSFRRASRKISPTTFVAVVVLLLFVLAAIIGPWVTPYHASAVQVGEPLTAPSGSHLLGTDDLGRDEFSRIIVAARIALLAAVESVSLAALVGCTLGIVAAYFGSAVDFGVLRVADILFSMPEFLIAIVIIAALGPSLTHATLAIAIAYTPRFVRISRIQALNVMGSAYVDASRLAKRSGLYVMARHIVPNVATPVIVLIALSMASAQLTYSALSFLGFGARPPAPDYGQMLADAQLYMIGDPMLVIGPAVALTMLIIAFNLLGDALRDRFDPRQRGGGV